MTEFVDAKDVENVTPGDIVHIRVHTQHIIILNSYEAVIDLFDKRGSIYSHRSQRAMAAMYVLFSR
jgi:quercetin dioxygenase-like cupin family protein